MDASVTRQANRHIHALVRTAGNLTEYMCECGDVSCAAHVLLDANEFADVEAIAGAFIAVPGHEPAHTQIIRQRPSYLVLRKVPERTGTSESPRHRDANLRIDAFAGDMHRSTTAYLCECGAPSCGLTTVIAERRVFASVLAEPGARLVAAAHDKPGQRILAAGEGYAVTLDD